MLNGFSSTGYEIVLATLLTGFNRDLADSPKTATEVMSAGRHGELFVLHLLWWGFSQSLAKTYHICPTHS